MSVNLIKYSSTLLKIFAIEYVLKVIIFGLI